MQYAGLSKALDAVLSINSAEIHINFKLLEVNL